jgi:hypothetical protein
VSPAPPAAGRVVDEPGHGRLEVWALSTTEAALREILTGLFRDHWRQIVFGPLIQGAAWEIQAEAPPTKIGFLDGYLTVEFGRWHFHLCIGEHHGPAHDPTPPAVASHRRTSRAELYRRLNREGTPDSWGLRLRNGRDEPQIDILFPNPFLAEDFTPRPQPDWSRLALWDEVRRRYLGLDSDPRDRSGRRFIH